MRRSSSGALRVRRWNARDASGFCATWRLRWETVANSASSHSWTSGGPVRVRCSGRARSGRGRGFWRDGLRAEANAGPIEASDRPQTSASLATSHVLRLGSAGREQTGLYPIRASPGARFATMSAGNSKEDTLEAPATVPISEVRPVVRATGLWAQVAALAKYMTRTEVHTYAFSVAANVILSLFPFIVMMLTISRQVFHSQSMATVVGEMMTTFLPSNQDFIMRNMQILAHPHKSTQVYSIVMLLISSIGVFLPLEVALNRVWGVTKNRSYLHNQAVSLGLAFGVGVLAMTSVALTAGQKSILTWMFLRPIDNKFLAKILVPVGNLLYKLFEGGTMRICALAASILIFFLIYWILPNRKVPARAVTLRLGSIQ